ncbi:mediator of RNA polymerase II transcription subunit 14 [Aspergillus ambiguus]|uniref:mediator of RNA polymerase II transcription subunit 14 n=1 Tax=Aspergillus ambiguus TaxID=176160 RepID=UPI003CCDAA28
MPGVIMDDTTVGGPPKGPSVHDSSQNGVSTLDGRANVHGMSSGPNDEPNHPNGLSKSIDGHGQTVESSAAKTDFVGLRQPPELPHITQGFFPFAQLINRSVQQCWNELSELVTELAEVQIPSQDSGSLPGAANDKALGNQSEQNMQKKLRLLDFAHSKRAEFIKLLVLSQWSRQAADVSRLIDIQNFIRLRHQAYLGALQWVGDMKRDLVQAQVGNPDLKTALEVLAKGEVVSMPTLGYKPPRPLTAKGTLKRLQKINRLISVRLVLSDSVPTPFQTYRVHDGRVTFIVPDEFELDLSIGAEDESSQFYFVDIRFLFAPSSPIPKGRIFNELDMRINETLRIKGLAGCFDLLHGLVLTTKVNALFKQGVELGRGLWSDTLRVELLHRTLVLQYWALRPGPKSWLEIGIKSGRRGSGNVTNGLPAIGLRWIRDGQEVDSSDVEFDGKTLSMECILRSVIALHISHILSSVYEKLSKNLLFSAGALSLRGQLSRTEPGACQLDVQLTRSRHLRVSVEPMSGTSILSATPSTLERSDGDRSVDKPFSDEIVSRVARLRCISAIEEVEANARLLGFQVVNPRSLKLDFRRLFPTNILRFSFFWHKNWERNWVLAATSSMDGDSWWVVQLQPAVSSDNTLLFDANRSIPAPRSAQVVCNTFFPTSQHSSHTPFADMGHSLHGILTIYANARYLADLQSISFHPPLSQLVIEPSLRVPDISIHYQASKLPRAYQVALPAELAKKSFIKDTIHISFIGVDPQEKVAVLVAYGDLSNPPGNVGALVSKQDRSLVFRHGGRKFSIHLRTAAGLPVISELVERLQRLECALSILETLRRKKMQPQSFSLSQVGFLYGPGNQLSANIDIDLTPSATQTNIDPLQLASQEKPLFRLRLGIRFDYPNPHRRIQGSFTSILNNPGAISSLATVTELLSVTLPLMQTLDKMMSNPSRNDPLRVQVTARNAKTFQIHYPLQKARFQLVISQRPNGLVWVLREKDGLQGRSGQDQLKSRLKERLYDSRGDGWQGLKNGVVATIDKVGNLLSELDKCFLGLDSVPDIKQSSPDSKPTLSKPAVGNTQLGAHGSALPNANLGNSGSQKAGAAHGNADVIMID